MGRKISNVLTDMLVVCALVVTGLVARSEFFGQQRFLADAIPAHKISV